MRIRPDHSVLLPSSKADRRERPIKYAIASLLLLVADVVFLYHLADTPWEFLVILGLLAITFFTAVEALSRL
jgi:hypothetical protein